MKTYKSSDLTNKRTELIPEAQKNGVIIELRNTNGDVKCELVLAPKEMFDKNKAS